MDFVGGCDPAFLYYYCFASIYFSLNWQENAGNWSQWEQCDDEQKSHRAPMCITIFKED